MVIARYSFRYSPCNVPLSLSHRFNQLCGQHSMSIIYVSLWVFTNLLTSTCRHKNIIHIASRIEFVSVHFSLFCFNLLLKPYWEDPKLILLINLSVEHMAALYTSFYLPSLAASSACEQRASHVELALAWISLYQEHSPSSEHPSSVFLAVHPLVHC